MRSLAFVAFALVLAAPAARADRLTLDTGLMRDIAVSFVDEDSGDVVDAAAGLQLVPLTTLPAQNAAAGSEPPMLSGVGLGLQLGFPTSLTLKMGKAHDTGFVFGLGAGFGYRDFFPMLSLHADYQLHLVTLVKNADLSVTGYLAPGLWLAFFGNGGYGFLNSPVYAPYNLRFIGVGARLSFGASVLVSRAPVEIYLELTPAVFVFPAIDPGLGGSLGFRYYF